MLQVIILAVALFLIIQTIRATADFRNPSILGKVGENEVSSILRSLPQEYLVINNVTVPDQGTLSNQKRTTQIDHLVVSPYGIFVIETKNYHGWIFGSEKSKRWKETFKTTKGHYFYNPTKQNWGHVFALAEHLQLDTRVFKPIVVFSDSCQLHVETTTPVIYMFQLKGFILNHTQEIIPRRDVSLIFNKLSRINLIGDEIEASHIQSIGDRFVAKEMSVQQGKCPRCGGALKLRCGKYGQFYGCSNYPKCKFTYSIRS